MSTEKETYVRRRAFNRIHVTSWLIYLEKDGFVRCPFQNCNFMAFDVNEMCDHYGFCKGDSSFAKYVCEVCNGCTVSEKKLNKHRSRAHNIEILPEQADTIPEPEAEQGKPSRVLLLSWGVFFDKHKYIKCSNCNSLANTMTEMCHHYLVCKQQRKFLLYVCPECKGRTHDVAPLIGHLERAHHLSRRPDQFNHISRNMVQFWEKELRDEKYATCLHINKEKQRDCQYIDVDLLGINEHSQTCKGPDHILSSQWFCKFCPKWTSSEEKLIKHHQLSHYELYNLMLDDQNDQLNYSQGAVATVKQEVPNNHQALAVPQQFSPANKFVGFQGQETTGSTKKESLIPVKPFESVFIIKGEYGARHPQEIGKVNCVKGVHQNNVQKETKPVTISQNNVSPNNISVQKCIAGQDINNSIQKTVDHFESANVNLENVNNNILVEECSVTTVCNKDQENQEIFLDLVEDKLVARKSIDEMKENKNFANNVSKQTVYENQYNPATTQNCGTVIHMSSNNSLDNSEKHKKNDSTTIAMVDLVEDEVVTSKNEFKITDSSKLGKRELEVIELEEETTFKEQFTIDSSSVSVDGRPVSSGYICQNKIKLTDCNNTTSAEECSSVKAHEVSQELFQDEIEVIEVMDECSSGVKDEAKEECTKKENDWVGNENMRDQTSKCVKNPCYVLFKDELSSDEEGCTKEKFVNHNEKEDNIKLCFDWQSEKKSFNHKSPKNYMKRRSTDDNLERSSPTKCVNSPYKLNSHSEAGQSSIGLEEVERTEVTSYKGKKSYQNHCKTQFQAKNDSAFQNRFHSFGESQVEASKNSEKNDKLMLNETPSALVKEAHTNLRLQNKSESFKKETIPGVERLSSADLHNKTDNNTIEFDSKPQYGSSDRIECKHNKPVLDESSELKLLGKTKPNQMMEDGILNEIQLDTDCRDKKSGFQNSTVDESVRGDLLKGKTCIDLTGDDSQESCQDLEYIDQSSSLNSFSFVKQTNNETTGAEENKSVSRSSSVVSFFYHGKLNKPFLSSNTSNNKKSTEDAKPSTRKEYLRNIRKFSFNEPCSSGQPVVDKPHYESVINKEQGQDSSNTIVNENKESIIEDGNNLVDSDPTFDLLSSIQADFQVDCSSDEGTTENTITVKSNQKPVRIKTGTHADLVEKSLADSERNLEVRRISSDFFEESSLDEEDFLGTDEELDMKDSFFNGFQEISENIYSKNRRFRQFLNRISESENEEWYVNAGNLTMDVRKDKSFQKNYEYNSLGSFGEKMTVIVVDDDSDQVDDHVKPLEEYNVNCKDTSGFGALDSKSKLKENREFIHSKIHSTSIHKKDIMENKLNKLENIEIGLKKKLDNVMHFTGKNLKLNESSKENKIALTSLDSKPMDSFKISLSIDKISLSTKNRFVENSLQRTEEDKVQEAAEVVAVETDNSLRTIQNKTKLDITVEEGTIAIGESQDINSDKVEVQIQSTRKAELRNKSEDNINSPVLGMTNKSNHHDNGMVSSKNAYNDSVVSKSVPLRKQDYILEETTKNTPNSETNINDTLERMAMPEITKQSSERGSCKEGIFGVARVSQTGKMLEDSLELRDNTPSKQLKSKPEFPNERLISVINDVPGQIVCSTPIKSKRKTKNFKTTPVRTTTSYNSPSLCEDKTEQASSDNMTYSDDEPLSIIQKSCQASVNAVLSTKDNLLTDGFSPHDHIQKANSEAGNVDEEKPQNLDTATREVETNKDEINDLNFDLSLSENIKTGDNRIPTEVPKKRGRKPKIDQDKFKNKELVNISDNGAMVKTRWNRENLEKPSSNSPSNHTIAICNTSKCEGQRLENLVDLYNVKVPESVSIIKRRGRPPKRKVNEINTTSNKCADLYEFYKSISDDELLISVYSDEIENVLTCGILEESKDYNNGINTVLSNSDESNQVLAEDSKGVSNQKQHDPQNNTPPCNIGEIKVPKKRGRKPKLKLEINSPECKRYTANSLTGDSVLLDNGAKCNDLVKDSSVEKSGDFSVITVPKKRGRPAKLKLEINSPEYKRYTANSLTGDSVLLDNGAKCNDLVKDSSVEKSGDVSVITVPKKRGRPAKSKPQNHVHINNKPNGSETDTLKNDLLEGVTTTKSLNCSSDTVKVLTRKTRKSKLDTSVPDHENIRDGESCILENSKLNKSENKNTSCNKNLRPADTQITSSKNTQSKKSISSDLCKGDISETESKEEKEVILPKKRGRKPGKRIKLDSNQHQQSADLESMTSNILEEKSCRSSRYNQPNKEVKTKYETNETESISRKRKSGKLNSDINDTASEVSSVSAFSVTDMDCNSSVKSELLDTDVIFINEEKLNSSNSSTKRLRKRKVKPLKKLKTDDDDCSDGVDPDELFSSDDSDDDVSYEIPRQPNKRRKIASVDNDSDIKVETDQKTAKKVQTKTVTNSCEKVYFKIKHRNTDEVVCGACKQKMTYANYRNNHAIFKHYMLTWLEGEESPVDMTNQKEVECRLWFCKKRMGKTPFRCFVCNLPKLSAVGFYSHIQFCGKDNKEKESLLVTCELCGTRLMPSSYKPHMYIKHSGKSTEVKTEQLDQTLIVKGRRAAATRAVEVIQQCQTDEQDLEGPGSRPNSPDRKSNVSHLYSRPSKIVSPHEYKRWKESLSTTHIVACIMPGCAFTANTTVAFRKHYFTCPFGPPRLYKCRVCSFTSSTEELMVEHVEEKHVDETFSQPHGSDESSDESDGEQKHSKTVFSSSNLPFKFLKSSQLQSRGLRFSSKKRFFTIALTWTLKLKQSMLAAETLYPEAQPRTQSLQTLTAENATPYLPELTHSIKFRGSDGVWRKLDRFQGCMVDGVPMMFAGGPVWATAWAPVPHPEEHQYLAISPHTSMEITHKMASLYSYPGLVQIWALGPLRNIDGEGSSPHLVFGLAQQRGPVWGLSWCPAGAYTQERLGLLAAACGDGSVVVYSIPQIAQAPDNPLTCCSSVKPQFELKLGCEMMAQCLCVDWHPAAPHSIIAGGFANGMVALWDLTTTSPLIKSGTTIFPFKVIEAHHSAVTAVQLSCTKENIYMMTASLDRATKFWTLDDTTTPVNALRKASVTGAVMANNWPLCISAYDDVYSINNSHVTGYNYRETFTTANANFILQPGTVWGLSFNDWLNGCACASEMGKVNALFRQQLLVTEDSKKVNKSTFTEDLVSCTARSIRDDSPVTSGFGPMYSDCVSSVGLEFNFGGNMKGPKGSACNSENMDSFPIRSFNSVSWNPNLSSFTWLAAGMQCGLVVVPKLKSAPTEDLAELYKDQPNLV